MLIMPLLNPWFITGFSDGESNFFLSVRKDSKYKTGYRISGIFQISLHSKDQALLEDIRNYFGGVGI